MAIDEKMLDEVFKTGQAMERGAVGGGAIAGTTPVAGAKIPAAGFKAGQVAGAIGKVGTEADRIRDIITSPDTMISEADSVIKAAQDAGMRAESVIQNSINARTKSEEEIDSLAASMPGALNNLTDSGIKSIKKLYNDMPLYNLKSKTEKGVNDFFDSMNDMALNDRPLPDIASTFANSLLAFDGILTNNLSEMKNKINYFKGDIATRDIVKPALEITQNLYDQFKPLVGPLKSNFDEGFDELYETAGNVKRGVGEAAGNIYEGVKEGITSTAQSAWDVVTSKETKEIAAEKEKWGIERESRRQAVTSFNQIEEENRMKRTDIYRSIMIDLQDVLHPGDDSPFRDPVEWKISEDDFYNMDKEQQRYELDKLEKLYKKEQKKFNRKLDLTTKPDAYDI